MTQFAMNWGLLAGALVIGAPTMWLMKDTTEIVYNLRNDEFSEAGDTDPGTSAKAHNLAGSEVARSLLESEDSRPQ